MPIARQDQERPVGTEPGGRDLGRRIAEHLHDTAIQSLALANIKLAAVADALQDSGLRAAAGQLNEARTLIVRGMGECRSLMWDLRPQSPGWEGWTAAVAEYVEQMQTTFPVAIEMAADCDLSSSPLPASSQEALLRAARELIFNACKHGECNSIRISWRETEDGFQVSVKDDGKGFDPRRPGSGWLGGFGLANVRERIQALGGRVVVRSKPGHGADILVFIPHCREELPREEAPLPNRVSGRWISQLGENR